MAVIKGLADYRNETRYRAIRLSAARKTELLNELKKPVYKGTAKYVGSMALYHIAPDRYTNRAFPDGEPQRSARPGGRPKMSVGTVVEDVVDDDYIIGQQDVYDAADAVKVAKRIQTKYRKYAENAFRYASAHLELNKVALKNTNVRQVNSYIVEEMKRFQKEEHEETGGLEDIPFVPFNSRQ